MKILVICRPRTRSTFLINALSSFYNLENKDENYKFCHKKFNHNLVDNNRFTLFQNCIKLTTQNYFKEDNFIIKLFPRMLTISNYEIDSVDEYNFKHINDLSYFTNINKYDKVYFLSRNLVDSVCSWAYGNFINHFNFYNIKDFQETLSMNLSLEIDLNNDPILKFYIFEAVILDCWKSFLDRNINFTTLDYSDIPEYVTNNLGNIVHTTIETKFDYKNLISNYGSLETEIQNYYDICYNKVKNILFK